MSEQTPYRGQQDDRRYTGPEVDITYNVNRCIHAAICVERLAAVFDNKRRPWIDASQANADETSSVVAQCPSGALHVERKDGQPAELLLETTTLTLWQHGPIQVRGQFAVHAAGVEITTETRATLCRCGASHHKPFCDNSHRDVQFQAEPAAVTDHQTHTGEHQPVSFTATSDGPLHVVGDITIVNEQAQVIFVGSEAWLCRCGGSQRKPFCDGSHRRIGFSAP